jgi:hypothetical protein
MDGIAATAFKDPAHDVTAQHSPQSRNSESVRERASPAVSRRIAPQSPLRRLSRPLLARESYNGGEAKCRFCLDKSSRIDLTSMPCPHGMKPLG